MTTRGDAGFKLLRRCSCHPLSSSVTFPSPNHRLQDVTYPSSLDCKDSSQFEERALTRVLIRSSESVACALSATRAMEIELCSVEATAPLIRGFTDQTLDQERVDTAFGSVLVAHQGADHRLTPSRPVILTFHDLALNHVTNFQAFFASRDMQLLLHSFSVLHVNAPGQEEGAASLPADAHYPTLDQMAQQLELVCQHFKVRSVVGFGVGLGANVLARFALQQPQRVDGLFLVNATATRSSWVEWGFQVSGASSLRLSTHSVLLSRL